MKQPTCKTCRFWANGDEPGGYGETAACHRYPPVLVIPLLKLIVDQDTDATNREEAIHDASSSPIPWQYPATWDTEWCGEHQAQNISQSANS